MNKKNRFYPSRNLLLMTCVLFLSACTPQFEMVPFEEKFSDPSQPYGIVGINNRLSKKSSQGFWHIDDNGVYLAPFVYKDKKSHKIVKAGFIVHHYNYDVKGGFSPISQIIFLADGEDRIALDVVNYTSDITYRKQSNSQKQYPNAITEKGECLILKSDFFKLANSKFLEVKIVGKKLSQTYDRTEVSEMFLPNLREFYLANYQ